MRGEKLWSNHQLTPQCTFFSSHLFSSLSKLSLSPCKVEIKELPTAAGRRTKHEQQEQQHPPPPTHCTKLKPKCESRNTDSTVPGQKIWLDEHCLKLEKSVSFLQAYRSSLIIFFLLILTFRTSLILRAYQIHHQYVECS